MFFTFTTGHSNGSVRSTHRIPDICACAIGLDPTCVSCAREKMSDWKVRAQKRAASSQSALPGGRRQRKRSRTMMSSEEEEEEWSDEALMLSQVQSQEIDEGEQKQPVFTGQVSWSR